MGYYVGLMVSSQLPLVRGRLSRHTSVPSWLQCVSTIQGDLPLELCLRPLRTRLRTAPVLLVADVTFPAIHILRDSSYDRNALESDIRPHWTSASHHDRLDGSVVVYVLLWSVPNVLGSRYQVCSMLPETSTCLLTGLRVPCSAGA